MEKIISYSDLHAFTANVFTAIGCSDRDCVTATNALLSADLRGIDSHGVARLSGYVRLKEAGRVNPQANIKVVHETPSTAVIDGDAGLGLVVAPFAMDIAIKKARAVGTGWVAVRNSNHFGIAGYHAMLALKHDMIGMASTNASALVAPACSSEKMLGTNPIAVAIPAGKQPDFVGDFATTTASNGKLEILQRKAQEAPLGWVQTADGLPTTNAAILKENGSMLPLGGDLAHGSHKGYILGSLVDIFSGVLSGASYGPWAPPFPAYIPVPQNMPGAGLGHFLGAMRVDAFQPTNVFKKEMDNWIQRFRTAKPAPGYEKVLIPGDPEREAEKLRRKNGIPLLESVYEDLQTLAKKLGIEKI